ncbi:MAG: hypothetical protein LC776_00240 [Acidobacteria bacterium]|nr:hypothetical protein [Acidobacteriota bacterium]
MHGPVNSEPAYVNVSLVNVASDLMASGELIIDSLSVTLLFVIDYIPAKERILHYSAKGGSMKTLSVLFAARFEETQ